MKRRVHIWSMCREPGRWERVVGHIWKCILELGRQSKDNRLMLQRKYWSALSMGSLFRESPVTANLYTVFGIIKGLYSMRYLMNASAHASNKTRWNRDISPLVTMWSRAFFIATSRHIAYIFGFIDLLILHDIYGWLLQGCPCMN